MWSSFVSPHPLHREGSPPILQSPVLQPSGQGPLQSAELLLAQPAWSRRALSPTPGSGLCLRTKCHVLPRLNLFLASMKRLFNFTYLYFNFLHILFYPAFLCAIEDGPFFISSIYNKAQFLTYSNIQTRWTVIHTYTVFPGLSNLSSKIRTILIHFYLCIGVKINIFLLSENIRKKIFYWKYARRRQGDQTIPKAQAKHLIFLREKIIGPLKFF